MSCRSAYRIRRRWQAFRHSARIRRDETGAQFYEFTERAPSTTCALCSVRFSTRWWHS